MRQPLTKAACRAGRQEHVSIGELDGGPCHARGRARAARVRATSALAASVRIRSTFGPEGFLTAAREIRGWNDERGETELCRAAAEQGSELETSERADV